MERLALAVMVELSGSPAVDAALSKAGVLEDALEHWEYRRPRKLSALDFRKEDERAWRFAAAVASSFCLFRNDGDKLRDWMANSLEYKCLVTHWNETVN